VPVATVVRGRARRALDPDTRRQVAARVRAALRALDRGGSSATLVYTDDDEIRVLNRTYRDHDRATDVLSFHLQELAGEADPAGRGVALERLAIHGLCHLFGHDHKKKAEAKVMFALEKWLRRS